MIPEEPAYPIPRSRMKYFRTSNGYLLFCFLPGVVFLRRFEPRRITRYGPHRKEGTTLSGYETKVRLHIKPHIGGVKLCEVTDDTLDDLYRLLETAPCPTNKGKPLGAKSVRHVTNSLEAGENPVEVSANVRHHSPGYTMARYGHSRKDGTRRLAVSGAGRLGLSSLV
ncbi:hypothetical protein ACFRMN_37660 [Streptomyces sp. NPDC056835]|uniref:hypothetical protein n=1 Tax=Streptomyces sp. NPDC056835 TaxID=3345956 RepID=UPI0036B0BC87